MKTMDFLKSNIKKRITVYGLILLAGFVTSFVNSFSHPAIILFTPGMLFGLALAIPHFDKSRKQIIAIVTLPFLMTLICIFALGIGFGLGITNNSYSDNSGVVLVGIISSLLFIFIIDQYYPIENKKTSFIIIVILGISSSLICDYFFPTPNSKELNFGKMIFIWEAIVGFGLTLFVKFNWMNK